MNYRILLTVLALMCFGMSLTRFSATRGCLEKRAELATAHAPQEEAANSMPPETDVSNSATIEAVSPEILRLRAEVTRLSRRKRELASSASGAAMTNAGPVTTASTNILPLPPDT
jgi:hypothetical protein